MGRPRKGHVDVVPHCRLDADLVLFPVTGIFRTSLRPVIPGPTPPRIQAFRRERYTRRSIRDGEIFRAEAGFPNAIPGLQAVRQYFD